MLQAEATRKAPAEAGFALLPAPGFALDAYAISQRIWELPQGKPG